MADRARVGWMGSRSRSCSASRCCRMAWSLSLLAGVVLSNLPEGMSSSSGLKAAGWPRGRVVLMWSAVVAVSAVSAAAGYLLLDPASGRTRALVQAFAAGALLAMLADTLLPEACRVEGVLTRPLVRRRVPGLSRAVGGVTHPRRVHGRGSLRHVGTATAMCGPQGLVWSRWVPCHWTYTSPPHGRARWRVTPATGSGRRVRHREPPRRRTGPSYACCSPSTSRWSVTGTAGTSSTCPGPRRRAAARQACHRH